MDVYHKYIIYANLAKLYVSLPFFIFINNKFLSLHQFS